MSERLAEVLHPPVVESTTAPLQWDGLSMLRGDGEGAAVRFSLAKAEPQKDDGAA